MRFRFWCRALFMGTALVTSALASAAQALGLDSPVAFQIAAQPLDTALLEFARQSGIQVISATADLAAKQTNGLRETRTPRSALEALLLGTGLRFTVSDDRTVTITGSGPQRGAALLRPAALGLAPERGAATLPPSPGGFDEIVVTAQKRSESIQAVPISMTAFSGRKLERLGATEMVDFARDVPGLSVASNGPGQNQMIIRGVSSVGGSAATVGYYLDETPVSSRGRSLDANLFDLERVEVLRGPQGTLYGSSSMGGTIKYVTKQPDFSGFSARAATTLSVTEGGGFNYAFNAAVNQPVVEEKVAVRATGFYRHEDGYIDRYRTDLHNILAIAPNSDVKKNVNTEETWGSRVVGRINVTDRFSVTPSIYYQQTKLGAPFNFDKPPGDFRNPIQSRLLDEPITDRFTLSNLLMKYEFDSFSLLSSTSYFDRNYNVTEDASKVNYFFFGPSPQTYVYPGAIRTNYHTKTLTQEVRLASNWSGPFQLIAGAYYSHQRTPIDQRIVQPAGYAAAFGNPFGPQDFFYGGVGDSLREKAGFAEASYELLPGLKLTAGLRVFEVKQTSVQEGNGIYNGGYSRDDSKSADRGANPKFLVSYQATPEILTYATAAKGFRPGGPGSGVPYAACASDLNALGFKNSPTSYQPDTLWNYEVGAKTSWMNNRLIVNGALYHIDWDDVQQSITLNCGFSFTNNFGKAQSRGGEIEVSYQPIDGLTVTAAASYTNATLTSSVPGTTGSPGDRLQNVPRWSLSGSVEYVRPLNGALNAFGRVDVNYTSHVNASFDRASPYYQRGSYALTKLRFGLEGGDTWEASLFVDNLFDRRAQTGLPVATSVDLPVTRPLAINRPRTIGVNGSYRF